MSFAVQSLWWFPKVSSSPDVLDKLEEDLLEELALFTSMVTCLDAGVYCLRYRVTWLIAQRKCVCEIFSGSAA